MGGLIIFRVPIKTETRKTVDQSVALAESIEKAAQRGFVVVPKEVEIVTFDKDGNLVYSTDGKGQENG